jgi:hypothetical protein
MGIHTPLTDHIPGDIPGRKERKIMGVLIYGTNSYRRVTLPFEGSAGLTRGTVRVEFPGLPDSFRVGEVLPGTVSLRTAGKTAVLEYLPDRETPNLVVVTLHSGGAGTFRQLGAATVEPACAFRRSPLDWACSRRLCEHREEVGHDFTPGKMTVFTNPHPGVRWEAASSSGGADIYAAVAVLSPEDAPLTIVTSGYRGRSDWKIHTIAPSGAMECIPYSEYVAKHTPAEVL